MMIRQAALMLLFLCSTVSASDLFPKWSGWRLEPSSIGCSLENTFLTATNFKGELKDTPFYRIHFRFSAFTFADNHIKVSDLYRIRLHIQVEPRDGKVLPADRISKAVVNGFEASPKIQQVHHSHDFSFGEHASNKVFEIFSEDKPMEITLIFKNGEHRPFHIYPRANKVNHVFAAMFQACIQEHRKR